MNRWWSWGALLLTVAAALAVGPKVGEKAPTLPLDPVNDDKDETACVIDAIGDKPAVIAFVMNETEENGQLAMQLEQAYRQGKERGLKAYLVVPGKEEVRARLKSLCEQYQIQVPVANLDPEAEELKAWDLKEAKENLVVFLKQGKVNNVLADVTTADQDKLRNELLALFM